MLLRRRMKRLVNRLLVDAWLPWKPEKEGEAMSPVEAGNGL